ncbi:DUF6185 family protein [Mycolicibacterium sp. 050158]|uniref:DUF6185 family protein n=1 Tax=Mycolicibacterium sp. 050158 TaxID=3090602 RepID=UPI00299CED9D|nr:DUF6185 family protein [Mycolicibacterium sp. 050158]MDX1891906.1 DUF6185 family protein [Mycolicibacterium sp. 050158]
MGIYVILYRVSDIFQLAVPAASSDARTVRGIALLGTAGLSVGVGYTVIGPVVDYYRSGGQYRIDDVARAIGSDLADASTVAAVQLIPTVALALVAIAITVRLRSMFVWHSLWWPLALMLAIAVPFAVNGTIPFVIDLPVWIIQFIITAVIFKYSVKMRTIETRPRSGERFLALAQIRYEDARQSDLHSRRPRGLSAVTFMLSHPVAIDGQASTSAARILFLGPRDGVAENARYAARMAGAMSVVPVSLLAWNTLSVGGWQSWGWGTFITVIVVMTEAARWLAAGFVFGLLYSRLPTLSGPTKGLVFAAIWASGAWASVLVSRVFGVDIAQQAIYRTIQFAVFMLVLGLLYDLQAIRCGGGNWRDLRRVYALHNVFEVVAAIAPALLLTIALIQQISSGSAVEVADTLINGFNDIAKGVRPSGGSG